MTFNVSDSESGRAAEDIGADPSPPIASLPGLPLGGMEHAKQVLAEYLSGHLPPVISALRATLNLPPSDSLQNALPTPDKILGYEPPALDASNLATSYSQGATALVYVSCMRLARFQMVDIGPTGDPEWWAYYPMSVITWVKGQSWPDTITASNNLVTAVRACLMIAFGADDPDFIKIDPNTYTEQAVEPEILQGNRHVRAAAANFTMRLRETLVVPPLGHVAGMHNVISIVSSFSTLPDPAIYSGPFSP